MSSSSSSSLMIDRQNEWTPDTAAKKTVLCLFSKRRNKTKGANLKKNMTKKRRRRREQEARVLTIFYFNLSGPDGRPPPFGYFHLILLRKQTPPCRRPGQGGDRNKFDLMQACAACRYPGLQTGQRPTRETCNESDCKEKRKKKGTTDITQNMPLRIAAPPRRLILHTNGC